MIRTPPHDLIDNREPRIDIAVAGHLDASDRAHFALGHLHLPGLSTVIDHVGHLTQWRLLVGNTTHDATVEQLFERHLDRAEVERQVERQLYLVCSPILGPPQLRVPNEECCYSDACKSNEQA